jgi:hypothetical protein
VLTVHPTLLIGPSDWQPQRMPKEEFLRRIAALWDGRPGASHVLVYGNPRHHAELAYLTNFVPKLEAALALISRTGEHRLLVGGGPNMLDAARPLTFVEDLMPLRELERLRISDAVLIGGGNMPAGLRETVSRTVGETVPDATDDIWTLMRHKSALELDAIRTACETLSTAMTALAHAKRAGLPATEVVLAGEKIAYERGAQDVRTLFSINAGRTLVPFTGLIREVLDPLPVYIAVRQLNYWAEGFVQLTSSVTPISIKAAALLHNVLAAIKPGGATDVVAQTLVADPYRMHPVTAGGLGNAIGLALEEPPYTDLGSWFEAGEVYSVRIGLTDSDEQHAIVSAMVLVREEGIEVLWPPSAAHALTRTTAAPREADITTGEEPA